MEEAVRTIDNYDLALLSQRVTVHPKSGGKFYGEVAGMSRQHLLVRVDGIDIGRGIESVKNELRKFEYPVGVEVQDGG